MATRIARFVTEVAPPQFVSVMRHRAPKMLDTINEDEKEFSKKDSLSSLAVPNKISSWSSTDLEHGSFATLTFQSSVIASSSSSSSISEPSACSNYFLKKIQRPFSAIGN